MISFAVLMLFGFILFVPIIAVAMFFLMIAYNALILVVLCFKPTWAAAMWRAQERAFAQKRK